MIISTSNPNDFGPLYFTLTIKPAIASPVYDVNIDYVVNLHRCLLDELSITTVISDFDYFLGSGDTPIGPNIVNQFAECPLSFTLAQDGGQPGNYYQGVFDFNESTG